MWTWKSRQGFPASRGWDSGQQPLREGTEVTSDTGSSLGKRQARPDSKQLKIKGRTSRGHPSPQGPGEVSPPCREEHTEGQGGRSKTLRASSASAALPVQLKKLPLVCDGTSRVKTGLGIESTCEWTEQHSLPELYFSMHKDTANSNVNDFLHRRKQ